MFPLPYRGFSFALFWSRSFEYGLNLVTGLFLRYKMNQPLPHTVVFPAPGLSLPPVEGKAGAFLSKPDWDMETFSALAG